MLIFIPLECLNKWANSLEEIEQFYLIGTSFGPPPCPHHRGRVAGYYAIMADSLYQDIVSDPQMNLLSVHTPITNEHRSMLAEQGIETLLDCEPPPHRFPTAWKVGKALAEQVINSDDADDDALEQLSRSLEQEVNDPGEVELGETWETCEGYPTDEFVQGTTSYDRLEQEAQRRHLDNARAKAPPIRITRFPSYYRVRIPGYDKVIRVRRLPQDMENIVTHDQDVLGFILAGCMEGNGDIAFPNYQVFVRHNDESNLTSFSDSTFVDPQRQSFPIVSPDKRR